MKIVPAHEISLSEQARVFTDAFTGYIAGSLAMDAEALARFLSTQGTDLCYSRFAQNSRGLCGFGYITRTGNISRLAGMGVIAEARRAGVARTLLLHLVAQAGERGDRTMMLEVIEQNPPAHALYRKEGFREISRLCGWRRSATAGSAAGASPALKEISPVTASQLPSPVEFPELPWQISRHAIAKLPTPRAYSSGEALVVTDRPNQAGPIRICALFSFTSQAPDWKPMRAALAALIAAEKGREFLAPAIFPEQFGEEIFVPLGFVRQPISQFLMRRDL